MCFLPVKYDLERLITWFSYWLLHFGNYGRKIIREYYQTCCRVDEWVFSILDQNLFFWHINWHINCLFLSFGGVMSVWWKAIYESHIYTAELGMLPSSTQIHNFTSFNWLIIYSLTVGAISHCNIFCKYRSCIFFSWTCRNTLIFVDEIHLIIPGTEPILLQFLKEEQLSQTALGQNWSDTIQYPFSPGSTFFFS